MSSLSVKRSNNNNNVNIATNRKYRGKKLNSTNDKTRSRSLKSRIFRMFFNVKDNNDDINNIDDMNSNNDKTDDDKNKAFKINSETVDGLEVEENRDFISYKDIKAIFDEIDRKFGEGQGGENWSQQYQHYQQYGNNFTNNSLMMRNCEMQSPLTDSMETSDYGENENENNEIPIWEQNQNIPSLSFRIRFEDDSHLKNESNFVLIHLSDLYCSNIIDSNSTFSALNNYHINDTVCNLDIDDGEFEFV